MRALFEQSQQRLRHTRLGRAQADPRGAYADLAAPLAHVCAMPLAPLRAALDTSPVPLADWPVLFALARSSSTPASTSSRATSS
jgi:hypothetical protein